MTEEGSAALDDSEEVDVIWEGSPLHEHMKQLGLKSPDGDVAVKRRLIDSPSRPPADLKPGSPRMLSYIRATYQTGPRILQFCD